LEFEAKEVSRKGAKTPSFNSLKNFDAFFMTVFVRIINYIYRVTTTKDY
jgi:hypothetical protein